MLAIRKLMASMSLVTHCSLSQDIWREDQGRWMMNGQIKILSSLTANIHCENLSNNYCLKSYGLKVWFKYIKNFLAWNIKFNPLFVIYSKIDKYILNMPHSPCRLCNIRPRPIRKAEQNINSYLHTQIYTHSMITLL